MRFRIVLVRPRYGGNVGSAVRVAANFGVREVTLVEPGCVLEDDPEYVRMVMGGDKLVTVATAPTLSQAIGDAQVALATTSRRRREPRAILAPAEAAQRLAESGAKDVALVFGSERGGLSHDELRSCQMTLAVPTDPGFPVLNLAQAVGIVLALLGAGGFELLSPPDPMDLPAPHGEFSAALAHLEDALLASGYLDPQNPARVADQFRRWFGRTAPTRRELALLRALAAHVTYLVGRSDARP